ncbi:MAG: MerR family transcriptional regulator [Oscillospiraceae bacterium]|nr:MerR family transcriptional regulator [Oscillospiraceae bacterium]
MKINQVEELVGITKKNIRFYEDQRLLRPERNPENGYREYSMRDVEQLKRVKLLRKLDVPCEQIRRVMAGELSLSSCVSEQAKALEKRSRDFEKMQEICGQLADSGADLETLDSEDFLARMKTLEKGGVQFMDTNRADVRKRQWGAWISATVMVAFLVFFIAVILWGNAQDPLPPVLLVFILLIPVCTVVGVGIALAQRMKELKGGELDEAGKY